MMNQILQEQNTSLKSSWHNEAGKLGGWDFVKVTQKHNSVLNQSYAAIAHHISGTFSNGPARTRAWVCVFVCVSHIGTVESRAHGDKVSLQESGLKSTLWTTVQSWQMRICITHWAYPNLAHFEFHLLFNLHEVLFFSNFKLFILCWDIANWQCFRWTVKGLSHTYTCIHSPPNIPPVQTAT